eukprot:392058-Pleurochrysis_carterae.AAC.1
MYTPTRAPRYARSHAQSTRARIDENLDKRDDACTTARTLPLATPTLPLAPLPFSLPSLPRPRRASSLRHSAPFWALAQASSTVKQAASVMAHRPGGLLVGDGRDPCVGIVTAKDVLFRVVAQGLPAHTTLVSAVMTPQPDTMPPSATVLDALRQLQGSGYRTVPVVSASREPYGVLDILALVKGALLTPASVSGSVPPSLDGSRRGNSVENASSCGDESELWWRDGKGGRGGVHASYPASIADDAGSMFGGMDGGGDGGGATMADGALVGVVENA